MSPRWERSLSKRTEPMVAVLHTPAVVPQRVTIPLWATALGALLRLVWRLVCRLVRSVIRHPVIWSVLVVLVALWLDGGWWEATGGVAAAGVVLAAWWQLWPVSFSRWVSRPLLGWWRWQLRYRRRWHPIMQGCGLVRVKDGMEFMPHVATICSSRYRDELVIHLAPGQVPADVAEAADALGHALRVWRCTVKTLGPGRVLLTVLTHDPLLAQVDPIPAVQEVTPDSLLRLLQAVPVGRTETGDVWTVKLLGRHVLVVGTTGAGKSGFLWSTLWALSGAIRSGLLEVTALDPKRMELRAIKAAGLGRVITDVSTMPDVLEELVREMDRRCDAAEITGRCHVPAPGSPARLIIVDELATLTALLPDKKARDRVENALGALLSRGRAAGYIVIDTTVEPTKEIVRWRGLHSVRLCCRTDEESHADLTLGDGAHDRGARTEEIHEDLPGIAYVRLAGSRDPVRVRIAHVTDEHIAGLITDVESVAAQEVSQTAATVLHAA